MHKVEAEAFEAARRQWNTEQDRMMAFERELRKRIPLNLSRPVWYARTWRLRENRRLSAGMIAALYAGSYAAFICPIARSPWAGLVVALLIYGVVYCRFALEGGRQTH